MSEAIDPKKAIQDALKQRQAAVDPLIDIERKLAQIEKDREQLLSEQSDAYNSAVSAGWTAQELSAAGLKKRPKPRRKSEGRSSHEAQEVHADY